jgi:YidC/Oxa1 family membrane protein insertase
MNWFDGLLYPIMVVVAWIMVRFHDLFTWLGLDPASGLAWALSIVGLVIVMRIILIPLFFKQIKASRGMQLIQPEMQKIQKKYKGKTDPASREAMSRETMELYRKHGTNPFSSCLPILAQSPIFFALFRVLNSLPALSSGDYPRANLGPLTQQLAAQAESATIFGAPLSGTFMTAANFGDGSQAMHIRVVTIILVIAMSVTTFTTQRQLTMKNMPPAALQGPMAQQQKMLMYIFPLIFAFSGVNFPIGVLIYWTTTNLWTMGQQFYTIRKLPAPGSQAEAAMKARKAKKAARHGGAVGIEEGIDAPAIEETRTGQRQQPVRKDRARKPRPAGTGSGTGSATEGATSGSGGATSGAKAAGAGSAAAKSSGTAKPAGTAKAAGSAKTSGTAKAAGSAKSGTAKASGSGAGTTGARKPGTSGAAKRPATGTGSGTAKKKPATPSSDSTKADGSAADE